MQIVLNQRDLDNAVRDFVQKSGINLTGKTVDISITAGRGNNGGTATVDINGTGETTEPDTDIVDKGISTPQEEKQVSETDSVFD